MLDFITELEGQLGVSAVKNFLPLQPGDVASTHADISSLEKDFGYRPQTPLSVGIAEFLRWYRSFYAT